MVANSGKGMLLLPEVGRSDVLVAVVAPEAVVAIEAVHGNEIIRSIRREALTVILYGWEFMWI